ncbi:NAD(P)-dependent oxidoreductase [Leptolyngbyaceae cyanobacterium UHCC 1019]
MQIGFIGIGLMGLPMAQRLLEAGLPLTVYNRTPGKLEELKEKGAAIAPTPTTLIHDCDCIILMLTNAAAVQEMLLSETNRAYLIGKTVIQMSTIAPSESRAIGEKVVAAGGEYLEAPVLGSIPEAKVGKLIVMVGSTSKQFETYQPILSHFGSTVRLIGDVGTASALKLALNQLIGSLTAAFATSLSFIQKEGVDVKQFMEILRGSALYAPTFDKKLQRMRDQNYANPNFPTKHLAKDMKLFQAEAEPLGLDIHLPAAVNQILLEAINRGFAEADYCALFAVMNQTAKSASD